jgi:hypothetical protein
MAAVARATIGLLESSGSVVRGRGVEEGEEEEEEEG